VLAFESLATELHPGAAHVGVCACTQLELSASTAAEVQKGVFKATQRCSPAERIVGGSNVSIIGIPSAMDCRVRIFADVAHWRGKMHPVEGAKRRKIRLTGSCALGHGAGTAVMEFIFDSGWWVRKAIIGKSSKYRRLDYVSLKWE
jgi:hypothetical protein